jgi:glyoxylase-like metal-dependent hydrolase (beta-lactamase superfamily II)
MRICDLHFIQAGFCRHCEAMTRRGGSWRPAIFPALAGLILHESGPVLFDTGYDPAFFAATQPFPQRLYRWLTPPEITAQTTVAAQLGRFNLRPEDIRCVILSHFHADHIAGLRQFPRARIVCSRVGLQAARRGSEWSALRAGVLRTLIPLDFDQRAGFFEDCTGAVLPRELAPFGEAVDILGDGAMLAVPLAGHAPGQFGLVVRAPSGQLNFLAADAAWSSRAIRENSPPPWLTTALLGGAKDYRATLDRLHRLATRNPEVLMTPSHCAERAAQEDGA